MIYHRTQGNVEKMDNGNFDIFELNFDREMSNQAKVVTQTILLSSMSYMHDLKSISARGGEDLWQEKIDRMCSDYWNLIGSFLINFGHDLNEDQLIESPKALLIGIETSLGDESVSKSKILTLVRSKVYYSLLDDLKELKEVQSTIFTVILLTKVFAEVKGAHFTGPLYDSFSQKGALLQRIFSSVFKNFDSEDVNIVKKFTKEVKTHFNSTIKVSSLALLRGLFDHILDIFPSYHIFCQRKSGADREQGH